MAGGAGRAARGAAGLAHGGRGRLWYQRRAADSCKPIFESVRELLPSISSEWTGISPSSACHFKLCIGTGMPSRAWVSSRPDLEEKFQGSS